jgi:hypothetical protein
MGFENGQSSPVRNSSEAQGIQRAVGRLKVICQAPIDCLELISCEEPLFGCAGRQQNVDRTLEHFGASVPASKSSSTIAVGAPIVFLHSSASLTCGRRGGATLAADSLCVNHDYIAVCCRRGEGT